MFDWVRELVLRFMRIPPEPEPPFGAPGSIRVFRAGRNYYNLRLFGWIVGQAGATIGILFSLGLISKFESDAARARTAADAAASQPAPAAEVAPAAPKEKSGTSSKKQRSRRNPYNEAARRTPWWVFTVVNFFEFVGIALFLVQIPITYAMVRLEFEQHWYIVTDRSLRIRTGLATLQESTMSYANLQQVQVKQGPLQRILGLADVEVQSAGGGGDKLEAHGASLHTGVFRSVENATEIRDLILERLRVFRQAGLGDPEDERHELSAGAGAGGADDMLLAARELVAEARALRSTVG